MHPTAQKLVFHNKKKSIHAAAHSFLPQQYLPPLPTLTPTTDRGGQETPADGNGKGSEDDNNKGGKKSEGNDGEGDKGNDGNFPKGGGRRWTQQSTKC
jgi:hypothetical protein